jgi:hypothetical protein
MRKIRSAYKILTKKILGERQHGRITYRMKDKVPKKQDVRVWTDLNKLRAESSRRS